MAAVEEWADGQLVSRIEVPDEPTDDDAIAVARAALVAATTIAELRVRTLELFDLLNPQEGSP